MKEYYYQFQKDPWRETANYVSQIDHGDAFIIIANECHRYVWQYYFKGQSKTQYPGDKQITDDKNNAIFKNKKWGVIIYIDDKLAKKLDKKAKNIYSNNEQKKFNSIIINKYW